jgi:hypothetical protein
MKKSTNLKALITIAVSMVIVIGFQNCAPAKNGQNELESDGVASNLLYSSSPSPTFTYTISDPNNYLGTKKTLMMENLKAAAKLWAAKFKSSASLHVKIDVFHTPTNFFGGASVTKAYIGTYNGLNVAEEGALYEMRTGKDPNGTQPDITLWVDPDYLNNEMWLDPQPYQRTADVPYNRLDGVSVFLHELGHAFGFNGYWPNRNVALPAGWIGVYDKFIQIDSNGKAWFNGANTKAAYGNKLIPLCTENNYHMGNIATSATDGLAYTLMTGNYFMYDRRYNIGKMELAVLKDLGAPLK